MFPREYLVPYLMSNAMALGVLALAFAWPRTVKWIWVGVFAWAAAINTLTASREPWMYLAYGALTPSEVYRGFIEGWFSDHIAQVVLSIAIGQLVIAALLAHRDHLRRLGVLGAVIFLAAIAPLGVGSGFPFSLTAIASLLVVERRLSAAERHASSPVSRFVPLADAFDTHTIAVHAPASVVFDVARHADLMSSPLARAIFRIRSLVMRDRPRRRLQSGLVAETLSLGWGVLAFNPGRVLVMGAVARPWKPDVTFSAVEPSQFMAFREPDLVKIAWSLEVEPRGAARTLFRTETRVAATDDHARKAFRRYWMLVSPGVRLIRWMMLRALKHEAERQYRLTRVVLKHAA